MTTAPTGSNERPLLCDCAKGARHYRGPGCPPYLVLNIAAEVIPEHALYQDTDPHAPYYDPIPGADR